MTRWTVASVVVLSLLLAVSRQLAVDSQAAQTFGQPLVLKKVLPLREAVRHAEKYGSQKLLLEGKITHVCQSSGCWLVLSEGNQAIRIKFEGYAFFIPKDSRGKKARVEGKLVHETISEKTARHYASEQGQPRGRFSSHKRSQQVVAFEATGVQIFQ